MQKFEGYVLNMAKFVDSFRTFTLNAILIDYFFFFSVRQISEDLNPILFIINSTTFGV